MRNFLPFARLEQVRIDFAQAGKPGRGYTHFQNLATGSALKAHIDDAIIVPNAGRGYNKTPIGPMIKMRIGKDGHQFLTEEYYDYRCYADGSLPLRSIWDWSGIKRSRPYRLYPGQRMHVMLGLDAEFGRLWNPIQNLGVLFFCRKVSDGSAYNLYDKKLTENESTEVQGMTPIMLSDCVMNCPNDSPLDIYGINVGAWNGLYPLSIYIIDGDQRPFWMDKRYYGIISPLMPPTLLGNARGTDEWALDPNETITFDFETPEEAYGDLEYFTINVIIRGTLEVENGK